MKSPYQQQHAALVKQLMSVWPKTTIAAEKHFAEQFYSAMLVSDLAKLEAGASMNMVRSMFEFFKQRAFHEPKIRIFSPDISEHGYAAKSLVIELINDDMPFLIDSLTAELTRHGLIIHETYHPIFRVSRGNRGDLLSIGKTEDNYGESFIHFEVSILPEDLSVEQLQHDLLWVLNHVRAAVGDWKAIIAKAHENIAALKKPPKGFEASYVAEIRDFLAWLVDKNFVFLGYGEYDFSTYNGASEIVITASAKLGILGITDEQMQVGLETMPAEQRYRLLARNLLEITKSNRRSPVHRYVPMDYVAIKRFDDNGVVVGEARFLGLFTSNVYYQSANLIPLLRTKCSKIVERSGFSPGSHDGKAFSTILEFLPRDEVLQMSEDDLFDMAMGILSLEAKPGVRVFVRKDVFERFISAMVFVPREKFSTELRREIQNILEKSYSGTTTSFTTQIADAPLARLHLIIRTSPGDVPAVNISKIEQEIARLAYLWSDQLRDAINRAYDESKALKLHKRYAASFPQSYINRYSAQAACHDIDKAEAALKSGLLSLELYQLKDDKQYVHLKIYNPKQEIALSDILPLLENSGFRVIEEHPFLINPQGNDDKIWIRDFTLQLPSHIDDITSCRGEIEKTLLAVWQGEVESDKMNALVLLAGITHREATILRAVAKYLKQISFNATQTAIEQALAKHAAIVRLLIDMFHARLAPEIMQRDVKIHALKNDFEKAIEQVESAVEDRILKTLMQSILAILRSNYYHSDRKVLSFKFDSHSVPELPLPKPFAEIFVYSPRVEGIHLRGGKVARGGLRWSDRPDDFRTEVLGLMKAQMVKNAVIVPVGSKGGFIVKKPPVSADRDALQKEAIACYTLYLHGLLDVTDNLVEGKIVTPENVVRHDGDDPYLVVAADKGTATFSDIANSVSKSYNFWLGDAFASGGSAGYDHKKIGITARGAWISVTRHFYEMEKDIAKGDFTCIGIGDMSGDVFGNGMLLSQHTCLVAAFNHQHIFIDPAPDAAASFAERQRLFALPRSSWRDYNLALISKGGGIYERAAKIIEISPEAMVALDIQKNKLTPDELVRAILLAPVDLLFNGGIGTYVKAEDESNDQAGDRANNGVRVNGRQLRCKIVGEGGNLGFTQKGRIEYARNGGRINTDAIDNSAGVDCSDHEVNIKITFSRLLQSSELTVEKRNSILEEMTKEVAELVLKDNALQTLALTVAEQAGIGKFDAQIKLMRTLEAKGLLSRAIEFLPNDRQIAEMKSAKTALTRPELAVILAYSKMDLYNMLLASNLPDHPYFENELLHYFPKLMQRDYHSAILSHPLRREIIATMLTNSLINRMGCTFVNELMEERAATAGDIAASYAIVRDAFNLRDYWRELDALSGKMPVANQAQLFSGLQHFIRKMVEWLLVNYQSPLPIVEIREKLIAPALKRMRAMPQSVAAQDKFTRLRAQNAPESLAAFLANMEDYATTFDIVHLAGASNISEDEVAKIYGKIAEKFSNQKQGL